MNWLFELWGCASQCARAHSLHRAPVKKIHPSLWRLSEAGGHTTTCLKTSCTMIWSEQTYSIASACKDSREIKAQCDLCGEMGWSHISGSDLILCLIIITGMIIVEVRAFVRAFITYHTPDLWGEWVSFVQLQAVLAFVNNFGSDAQRNFCDFCDVALLTPPGFSLHSVFCLTKLLLPTILPQKSSVASPHLTLLLSE